MFVHDTLYIGGDLVSPAGTDTIEVISPHTEEVIGRVPEGTTADIDRAVAAARQAFDQGPWPHMAPEERGEVLARLSAALQARLEPMAELITQENGAPLTFSMMGQVLASTMVADYYVGLSKEYDFHQERTGMLARTVVHRPPLGVVGAIVPWNVPLFVTMLKLAPAMVAGCTMVLKPAPETPLDAYVLAECLQEAGLPPGVVNIVAAGREVGEHLVTHPDIDKVAFTGSTAAGRRIAALCGERLRPCTLELGGKSAAILLPEVDLDAVVAGLTPAAMMNNGQACVAQSRVLAHRDRYTEVVDRLSEAVAALQVGDPMDPATEVGPLVAARQRDRVEGYLQAGRDEGARVTVGGGRPAGIDRGWYVEPTVFADVDNRMRIAQEEIFGPVLAVIPYDDVDQAVAIANDSPYGLSGSVWGDEEQAGQVAARVRTGTSTVNGFVLEFGAPFGGFKQSGLGREMGPEGLEAYLETQSVFFPTF